MSANHVLLQRLEVTNPTSTVVSFRNIPQTGYTDLKIVVSARTVRSGSDRSNDFLLRFNDSVTGYSRRDLGDSAVRSTNGSSLSNIGRIQMPSDDATANTFGNAEIYISNYTSSQNKAVTIDSVSQDNNSYGPTWLVAGLWSNSTAISSISLTADQSGTITPGSTFSLYGIAKLGTAPEIAPKAFGGDIIANDGEYWYHAFLTTGSFKPRTKLNCDVLVVAGGGGGGAGLNNAGGGGGGAGGVVSLSSLNLSNTSSYLASVGAGGAGTGVNGINSQFASYTAAIGGGGGGGPDHSDGNSGGSGGGGRSNTTSVAAGEPGQGFAGGAGNGNVNYVAGGGGGAGGVGLNGTTGGGADGGPGTSSYSAWLYATNTGVAGYVAGGGGGSSGQFGNAGNPNGGLGGGGQGGFSSNSPDVSAGVANTGSGGGGEGSWSNSTGNGGAGGSGIVIVRYAMG